MLADVGRARGARHHRATLARDVARDVSRRAGARLPRRLPHRRSGRARRVRPRLDAGARARAVRRSPFRARPTKSSRLLALCNAHRVAGGALGRAHRPRRRRGGGARRAGASRSRACAAWIPSTCSAPRCACRPARSPRRCTSTARAHGLTWPVDFASKGSSQVGGNIATNAGGVKVIRYGLTRQWVLGLAGGARERARCSSSTARSRRTTPALDLRQLFIGSEGTLGIITEATLKLARAARRSSTCCSSPSPDLAGVLRALPRGAAGAVHDRGLRVLHRHAASRACCAIASCARRSPRRVGYYVLLEVEGADDDALEAWIDVALRARARHRRHARAARRRRRSELWALREGISESLSAHRAPAQERRRAARSRRSRRSARELDARLRARATRAGRSASSATSATATCTST